MLLAGSNLRWMTLYYLTIFLLNMCHDNRFIILGISTCLSDLSALITILFEQIICYVSHIQVSYIFHNLEFDCCLVQYFDCLFSVITLTCCVARGHKELLRQVHVSFQQPAWALMMSVWRSCQLPFMCWFILIEITAARWKFFAFADAGAILLKKFFYFSKKNSSNAIDLVGSFGAI